ncbi:type VI secretion lipoprotein TssJ [Yersinia enterocolitica]|uniref:type VI secretion lipoprotein TssJ n=1 Tax=Yersinia enterocolitica TaxID=630 RepID=UPI0021553AB2|nr:type VI secretion lipoprotein TssJ [Yersinia enterocolitica]
MITRSLLQVAFICIYLTGCTSGTTSDEERAKAINDMAMPFSSSAISLHINPSVKLNSWNDIPNSCTLLIVQAKEKRILQNIMDNPAVIRQLFEGAGTYDGILKIDRYVAMPGQNTTLHIDRSENTRYVSIIAGYYPFPTKQHMLLLDIPITVTKQGWWREKWSADLAHLNTKIFLEQEKIRQVQDTSENK